MTGSITDVPGVRVGHWTDAVARTGCTVVLLPAGTTGSGEVRGGAPGTREWALLSPERLVQQVDAVVLAGGSAFGLAACDGVSRFCEERGAGFPTAAGPVPIVVGAVVYDLGVGDPRVRPGPDDGYAACVAATAGPVVTGAVGAGAGASVGGWRGPDAVRPGGVGTASARSGAVVVGAVMAVNAFGDVLPPGAGPPVVDLAATTLAATAPAGAPSAPGTVVENTTIGVVATNARLDKVACLLAAQSAHDGLARCVWPAHSAVDGDAIVCVATGEVDAPTELVRVLATGVVEAAVRSAVA